MTSLGGVGGGTNPAGEGEPQRICDDMGAAGESPCSADALPGDDFCYSHGKAWDEQQPRVTLIDEAELAALRAVVEGLRTQLAAVRALVEKAEAEMAEDGPTRQVVCFGYDMTEEQAEAFDDRVMDAAHALDEEVFCVGSRGDHIQAEVSVRDLKAALGGLG